MPGVRSITTKHKVEEDDEINVVVSGKYMWEDTPCHVMWDGATSDRRYGLRFGTLGITSPTRIIYQRRNGETEVDPEPKVLGLIFDKYKPFWYNIVIEFDNGHTEEFNLPRDRNELYDFFMRYNESDFEDVERAAAFLLNDDDMDI